MVEYALLFGLLSSLHCVGMCGPIALMLPVDRDNQAKKAVQISIYHLGRISAYTTTGLLFGLLGRMFYMAGLQQLLSIIAGLVMILIAMVPERWLSKYNFSRPIGRFLSKIRSRLGRQFKKKSLQSLFTIGILNGFLPCGMVYAALFGALAMNSIAGSMVFMIFFGLGTVPLMSAVVYLNRIMTIGMRQKISHAVPLALTILGILFILRGMGLGIPYLSPSEMNLFVQASPNCH
ncbi:MAG: sulfite exporter TauE/SafE family protein [Flavobacterium sp.]|nr:sulfite exporter TauE/SafE family protein [Flavobacterium sp.]